MVKQQSEGKILMEKISIDRPVIDGLLAISKDADAHTKLPLRKLASVTGFLGALKAGLFKLHVEAPDYETAAICYAKSRKLKGQFQVRQQMRNHLLLSGTFFLWEACAASARFCT